MAEFNLPIAAADWHKPVELTQLGQSLSVTRQTLPLGEAVAAFMQLPADKQASTGIALHPPLLTRINDRPAALGWLNATSVHRLVADSRRTMPTD